ncbi:hypothetical protein EV191_105162 [Tamaricihabitans halophyticus]|uniref:DUF5667 domain-containing protein n=1 Tax=Tamaricihabitans halophyticus TaxID=1262583 RepID=A0A4R2QVJ2_9PSEU|nr:DUF5667 domain-containing protein [Tamaricihabitans halophyticus]TCP53099.1 hypothetical protein EV191_105162 [Tamaricihabitans halophyticus]
MSDNGISGSEQARQERFARAVAEQSRLDPQPTDEFYRELAVVGALRELGSATEPDRGTKSRIAADIADPAPRAEPSRAKPPSARRRRRGLGTAVAAAVLLLFGVPALLLAKDALPGESLYALKRATERIELALSGDADSQARTQFTHAGRRLNELALLTRAPETDRASYRRALTDFSTAATAGTRTLTSVATNTDGTQLRWLGNWVHTQSAKLRGMPTSLPPMARAAQADMSELLDRIKERASTLAARMPCGRITSASTDELGALPATGSCQRGTPERADLPPAPPPPVAVRSTAKPPTPATPDSDPSKPITPPAPTRAPAPEVVSPTPITEPPAVRPPSFPEPPGAPSENETRPPADLGELLNLPRLLPGLLGPASR